MASDDCHGEMEAQRPPRAPTALQLFDEVGASPEPGPGLQPVEAFLGELWEAGRRPAPEPSAALCSVLAAGSTAPVVPLRAGERRRRHPTPRWRRTLTVMVAGASMTAAGANVAAAAGFVDRSSPGVLGTVVRALVPSATSDGVGTPDAARTTPAGGTAGIATRNGESAPADAAGTPRRAPVSPGNGSGRADGAATGPTLGPVVSGPAVPSVPTGPTPPPVERPLPSVASPGVSPPELPPTTVPAPTSALPALPGLEDDQLTR